MPRRAAPEPRSEGPVDVAERVLRLLDEGRYTATYKQAVLVALMDLCLERTQRDGSPPDTLTTRQVAEKVVALYWPHTREWATPAGGRILVQNASGSRDTLQRGGGIVAKIRAFREDAERAAPGTATLAVARARRTDAFRRLVDDVEWTLVHMPLPKLQRIGDRNLEWLYRIEWRDADERDPSKFERPIPHERAVRAYQHGAPSDFDNRVHLQPGVASAFARLHALLRPYVLRHWTSQVVRLNGLPDEDVGGFLFEHEREDTAALRRPLVDLQRGLCFYCEARLPSEVHLDHFIPWARHPDNGVHNLVAADGRCNGAKRDFLASADHVARWRRRSVEHRNALERIANEEQWDAGEERIVGVARAIYLALPDAMPLWRSDRSFEASDAARLHRALVA